jgi:hypothetical protein
MYLLLSSLVALYFYLVLKHVNLIFQYDTEFMPDYEARMLLRGASSRGCRKQKAPVTIPSRLHSIFQSFGNSIIHIRMRAIFLVDFFSLLRASNLLPRTRAQAFDPSGCYLRRRDITFNATGVILTVHRTKTLQFRQR